MIKTRMKIVLKIPSSTSAFQPFSVLRHSTLSKSATKSSRHQRTQKKSAPATQAETNQFCSLFRDITDILGSDDALVDKSAPGFSVSGDTHTFLTAKNSTCTQPVCENAEEKPEGAKDGDVGDTVDVDVSPMVNKITEIVREDHALSSSFEDRLSRSDLLFDVEVVNKVLQRCFTVPQLAYRFFNWVRTRVGFQHTVETYNSMLSIAEKAREFLLVDKLLKDMEIDSCQKNVKTWTILISSYEKRRAFVNALSTFEEMKRAGFEPDVLAYKTMIHALCASQKFDIAMEFYKEMIEKELKVDMSTCKLLMKGLAESGNVADVHMVADDMVRISQISEPTAYACMLKSFCISGRINEALELVREFRNKNLIFDSDNLETLVRGLCRAGRVDDALEIVDIMKKKHEVNEKLYEVVIDGMVRKNELPKALELFQSLRDRGWIPMTSTWTQLMQHLFRSNDYENGCKMFDEMVELGVNMDCVTITAMTVGHTSANRIAEAWKVFKSMEGKGIKATKKSYFMFIKELCKGSWTSDVLLLLDDMLASKVAIGDDIFRYIAKYLKDRGETDMIAKVCQMKRICEFGLQGSQTSQIEASTDTVNKSAALQEIKMVKGTDLMEPKGEALHLVDPVLKICSAHDQQEVCRILQLSDDWYFIQEALEKCSIQWTPELVKEVLHASSRNGYIALCFFSWVAKQPGYSHTTETYNMAIKIAGGGKDFKHMRNLFYEMKRNGCSITSDTWTIMIMQYARSGLTDIALRLFKEMKDTGCKPTKSVYRYVIILLCNKKGRKVNEAVATFRQMFHEGHDVDKDLIETYLECMCEENRLSDAKGCVEALRKVGYSIPLCYSLHIRALCRARKLDEALKLLDEVNTDNSTLDQYTYGSIVHALLQKGRLADALAKVDSMRKAGTNPTVHVYTSFIVHHFKEKQVEKAVEMYEDMKRDGVQPTVVTYSALIRGYTETGRIIEAWDIFNSLKLRGPSPDFKTYSMFMHCLCKVGRSEEAFKLLSEMAGTGIVPSAVNFRTVYYGLNREGKHDVALSVLRQKAALKSKRQFTS
uniref:Pentatricopeptide repeat-containing protein-mitochondrial domain-containing protein n=1 Tax=Kalanchoe fedtschenkoi TaxID=63787 RepID=A0A7N0SV19_KALFE